MGSPVAALSRGYPADIRAGAGLKASTSGLALRVALDYSNVPVLQEAPADGQVLVQRSDGNFWRLDFGNLPTTTVADGTVTNAKFTNAPPFTLKGNATGDMAQPQDIALSVLAAAGNPIGDAIAAAASQAGSSTIVNGKPGPNITLSAADVGAAPMSGATFTGPVGSEVLRVVKGSDSTIAGDVSFDNSANALRIYETGGAFRGAYLDFNECGTQSKFWHEGNFDALPPAAADVATGFSTTKRPTAKQVADLVARINPLLRYGFVGDGTSRPISGVTRFNGINTTGYTLAQWQALVPEIGALTDEIDGVAIQATLNAQMSRDFVTVVLLPPASRAKISRTINAPGNIVMLGHQAWLESASPAADPIIRHGTAGSPSNGEMHLEGIRFDCASRKAVYAYFHPSAGASGEGRSFYMRACTFRGAPADAVLLVNAPRTIHVSCNSFWTPATYVVGAAFRAVAEPYATGTVGNASAPQNSGSFCFTLLDNLTSGFQYGYEFDIAPNNGAASGVIEGVLLYGCHSYNGQTMLKVTNARNSGSTFSYGTPLWVIRDCDYEGFGAFAEMSGVAEVTFDSNWLIINQSLCGGAGQPATPSQVNFFDLDYTLGATITNNTIGINQLKTPTVRCLDVDAYSSNTLFRDNLVANVGAFDCIAHYAAVANGLNAYTHMEWNTRFIYTDQPKPTVLVRDDGNNQYSQSRVAAYPGASMLPDGQTVYQAAPTCTVQANMHVTVPVPAGLFRETPRMVSCTTANYGQFPYRVEGVRNDFATTTQGIAVMQSGAPTAADALLLFATFRGR